MKKPKYLWISSAVGLLALAACTTTSERHSSSAPPETVATATPTGATGSYLVNLDRKAPPLVSAGEEFSYQLNVSAVGDVADTILVDTVPAGATFISSQPPAVQEGNKLTWRLGDIGRGQTTSVKVTLKAENEGDLANCATVSAIPRLCATTKVGRPLLTIKKSGPEMAVLGQNVTYSVVVQNTGTTPAKNVVMTDMVPEGLSSASGERQLHFNLGDLEAGASKTTEVILKADKRGKVCNKVVASFGSSGKVESETCTTVVQSGVKIEKTTKNKMLFVNRAAAYDIVVSNTGDTDLSGVVVTDTAAPETVIAAAEGAEVSGSTATWNLGTLGAGQKKNVAIKILSKVPGTFVDTASVVTAGGLKDSAQESTEWKGVTGMLVELVDDPDPIQVGETTKFTIRVTNQGTSSDIVGLAIVVTVPPELEVVPNTVSDGGTAEGKTVTWSIVPTVAPKASVTRNYIVKGVKAGDARSKVSVTTSQRKTPIEQSESTTVY